MTALSASEISFYIGTYTGPGKADGILFSRLNTETGALAPAELAVAATNPSFLAVSPNGKTLYAALENKPSAVAAAFRIEPDGKLILINEQSTEGAGACHVWVGAGHVFISNYSTGSIICYPIQEGGGLGGRTDFVAFTGSGPNPARQNKPHAHGMITDPEGKFAYACDLGTDKVWSFRFDSSTGKLAPATPPAGQVPPGGGPRHMALSRDGKFLYVNNEMGLSVTVFSRNAHSGALTELQTLRTLPSDVPDDGAVKTSEIALHPNGKWLYVSNRTHDSITVYETGADGRLSLVEIAPSQTQVPRGFAIDPTGKWLVVAGQKDNTVTSLRIDPTTGKLTPSGHRIAAATPVCIAFAP